MNYFVGNVIAPMLSRVAYYVGFRRHEEIRQDQIRIDPTLDKPLGKGKWRGVRALYAAHVRNGLDALALLFAPKWAIMRFTRNLPVSKFTNTLARFSNDKGGGIIAFGHFGSYAVQSSLLALHGVPMSLVARQQRGLQGWGTRRMCKRSGIELIELKRHRAEGAPRLLDACRDAVARGRVVGIAGDYLAPNNPRGVLVTIAGAERKVGAGLGVLAWETNCTPICVAMPQNSHSRNLEIRTVERSDEATKDAFVQACVQATASSLDRIISNNATQWFGAGGMVSDPLGMRASTRDASKIERPREHATDASIAHGIEQASPGQATSPHNPELSI